MSEKENICKELRSIAPNLEKLRDKNPFTITKGYFDELPNAIREKISLLERRKERQIIPVFSKIPRLALVGIVSVMLMVAGYFFLLKEATNTLNGLAEESVYEDYMLWYADYQADDFYDMILDNESVLSGADTPEENDQIVDYLLDYTYYYMESPVDITD